MRSTWTLTSWFAPAWLIAAIVTMMVGCSFESGQLSEVRCENEGVVEGARRCEDGFWIDAFSDGGDDGGVDIGDVPDTCVPPSAADLCEEAQYVCGTLNTVDSCGVEREVECGTCEGEPFEENVGEPYPCCESGETCQCQDVEQFEPRCEEGVCEAVSVGIVQRTSGCAACEAECGPYDDCDFASTCALTGTRSRSCVGQACVAGACVDSDEPFEQTATCNRDTLGVSCSAADTCSVGSCAAGDCVSTPICDGTLTSCGCESCQDCSDLDGWYNSGPATDCCDDGGTAASCTCQPREFREYSCDGTDCIFDVTDTDVLRTGCETCGADECTAFSSCDTGSVCGTTGTQERSCETAVCRPATGLCDVDVNVEEQACTDLTDGNSCDFEPFPGCNLGECSGGSCASGSPCDNSDESCGCASCEDCTALDDEWIFDESSAADCCEGRNLCECGTEERHEWVCGEAECKLSPTGETRAASRGCNTCANNCLDPPNGPCCSAGNSSNCE